MGYKYALVVGSGAFGTSIASVLSENFEKVYIKVRSQDVYESIKSGENSVYLPGQKLPKNLIPVLEWDELKDIEMSLIVNGLPSSAICSYYSQNAEIFENYFEKKIPFVSLSKGIDPETLEMADDLFMEQFPKHLDLITYLSGPSFAKEIIDRQITIVNVAGRVPDTLMKVCEMLRTEYFKAFPTYDIKGVLLGGALKNILAIAGGMIEGFGYNHNTRAAMITRGITEMLKFGSVLNARPETFYSFAGMGDLILTTTSSLSRNKSFGLEIAKGRSPQEIIDSQRSVVEGYKTSKAAFNLAQKYQINTYLFDGVYQILYMNAEPKEIIKKLMALPISIQN